MNEQTYEKFHGPNVENDWNRIKVLESICSGLEGVHTPQSHALHATRSVIAYEYYDFPAPLINHINDQRIFTELGELLARMHASPIQGPTDYFSSAPYPLDEFGLPQKDQMILSEVFKTGWLHGDFWHGNVFFKDGSFIIIDPIPASLSKNNNFIWASGAIDVAYMRMSLLFCHPLQKQLTMSFSKHYDALEAFTSAYFRAREYAPTLKVRNALNQLTRTLSMRFIDSYKERLLSPLALTKKKLALRTLSKFDQHTRVDQP